MREESAKPASIPTGAVFLSYASEDVSAAERIATALRSAGIEVWFDKSELRGGDAWDQSIRKQIKACALFVPIISKHTHERSEGYFRLEWKLAVDRCHLMAADKAFLVPVVIDDMPDDDERVPEKFRELQWMRLPEGNARPEFVTRIQQLLSGKPGHSRLDRTPAAVRSRRLSHLKPAWLALAVLLAGFATYLLVEKPWTVKHSPPSKPAASTDTAVAFNPPAHSIAVLPLVNESGDPNQQYFSDGLSEDLINALAQFPGLKVIGRHSSFQFRNPTDDSKTIGAKLGVAHLLEGSVRRQGEIVRVSAELIDTSDGTLQWSEHYDRPYKDLFALQDDITHAVAGALKTRLGDNAFAQSDRPPSGNLEAYSAYLQGNLLMDRVHDEADMRKAIDAYTAATRLDPGYARAWSALSIAWTDLGAGYATRSQEAYPNARAAADMALRLQPGLAAAHVARGWLFSAADLDQRAAEAEYRRAVQLAPQDALAKYFLAGEMAILGQLQPAIDLMRQALADDPLHAVWYRWLAVYLLGLNRLDEARQEIRKALELQPTLEGSHGVLTMIEVQRGDAKAALAAAQQAPAGDERDWSTTLALQIGNDRARADDALSRLIEQHSDSPTPAYDVAQIYALRKDADKTFEWLDRAWRSREPISLFLLYDPFILRYKDEPRFAALCRKVGLPTPAEVKRQG